jgi:hypothetical protein
MLVWAIFSVLTVELSPTVINPLMRHCDAAHSYSVERCDCDHKTDTFFPRVWLAVLASVLFCPSFCIPLNRNAAGSQGFRLFSQDAFRILLWSKLLAFEKRLRKSKNQTSELVCSGQGEGTPFSLALIPFIGLRKILVLGRESMGIEVQCHLGRV